MSFNKEFSLFNSNSIFISSHVERIQYLMPVILPMVLNANSTTGMEVLPQS